MQSVLLVWGRAPRPSKPGEAWQMPAVTATLNLSIQRATGG